MTRPPLRLKAVLFDWDGTLLDSAEASFDCYVRVFERFGIAFTRELFAKTYSPDWYRTYEAVGLPRERWSDADAQWLARYAECPTALLPGAAEAMRRFRKAGLASALVTSGSRARIERELSALSVEHLFQAVVCSEDSKAKKPDPAPLELGLVRLGIPASAAVFIGDSPEDVEMARAAGVFSVGVPGAFPNRQALESARPDLLAESLLEALERLIDG